MNKQILDERKRKVQIIKEMYVNRVYTQNGIAEKLSIPIEIVGMITRLLNFERTKQKTKETLRDGEKINMVIDYDSLDCLDAYDF